MITTANQPLFEKDKILLYYGGANFSHGVGEEGNPYDQEKHRFDIGLATLRMDGFVYASNGSLITKPLESKKSYIRVNADCKTGKLVIDLMRSGKKIKSFEMTGTDSLEHTFRTSIKGEIVLKVYIQNAKFYSLEVT